MIENNSTLGQQDNSLWYKDAVIYQLHVRAYKDSNEDGIGDFRGLTQQLDYLQDLGVTAIWLLPFSPSPLRDDGYDIADYNNVHSNYGRLRDFRAFLREAHERGLRVITELVINHTSDQHPWFQRSRRAAPGTRWRDFYVWNDSPDKYKDARIIFRDFESSNWSWDQEAQAYYWHRFYSHQPDLNFENPEVKREVIKALDFWLDMGVDGLRLDAIPYLYEREGTTCENLPETHAFLKELRKHIDDNYEGRMVLAEANQWPEDVIEYLGDGDECHMAFHFPVMPRLFMAVRMENNNPVMDIMQQTPPIPDTCQWAVFLRNHDELTLEMVTDEERDYMYRSYASDRQARINLGIRRRLAPLMGNDRRRIELMNGLLFSLSGTPIIYYGDEIGMGDNFYLGDRNGVRTPMQWSSDRNAGFSRANPQRLYFPTIIDPEYHYEALNVENQQNNPNSLLWWMKHLISLRKRYKVFGRGSLEFLSPSNRRVLAFVRRYQDQSVLVVANLSRFAQICDLNLSDFKDMVPVELFGRSRFPSIGEQPYSLTLAPYSFYWFSLESQPIESGATTEDQLPTLTVSGEWKDIFQERYKEQLEAAIPKFLMTREWFGGKTRTIREIDVQDAIAIPRESPEAYIVPVRVDYNDGEPDTFIIPMAFSMENSFEDDSISRNAIASLRINGYGGSQQGILYDAISNDVFTTTLLDAFGRGRRFSGDSGEIAATAMPEFRSLLRSAGDLLKPRVERGVQNNTSVIFGDVFILKLFRRIEDGINPDLEIGRYLTEVKDFRNVPPTAGALEYNRSGGQKMTVAMLQGFLPNEGDAWNYTLEDLTRYYQDALAEQNQVKRLTIPVKAFTERVKDAIPPQPDELIGLYMELAKLMGQRTGELHLALAQELEDPNFKPEPFTDFYQRSLYQNMLGLTNRVFSLLQQRLQSIPEETREEASKVLQYKSEVLTRFEAIRDRRITAMRMRVHGDFHLGQVLYTGKDFIIIDFEGESDRPLSERRIKVSPLKDVAGMLRSFHYVAHAPLMRQMPGLRPEDSAKLEPWANFWYAWVGTAFLKSYMEVAGQGDFLPRSSDDLRLLMDTYLLEKAIYELGYDLNNRPDWVSVPMKGILDLLEVH